MAGGSHVENAPKTMMTMTTCERASEQSHSAVALRGGGPMDPMPRREGGPEGKGRGDEEIMGVAGLARAVIVWEFESATSIISHSGNGQNKGNISCCYGLKCAFNRIEISYAM